MGRQKNFEIWIAEFKIFENREFPGETFRIPDKEEKQYGKYRTRPLVLEDFCRVKLKKVLPLGLSS